MDALGHFVAVMFYPLVGISLIMIILRRRVESRIGDGNKHSSFILQLPLNFYHPDVQRVACNFVSDWTAPVYVPPMQKKRNT